MDATTWESELGLDIPFGADRALDFGLAHYDSKINEGPDADEQYGAWSLRASFLYRFQ